MYTWNYQQISGICRQGVDKVSERQSRQRRGSKVGEEEDPAQEKEPQQGREARSLCSPGSQVRKADDSCCEVKLDAQSPFLHFVG